LEAEAEETFCVCVFSFGDSFASGDCEHPVKTSISAVKRISKRNRCVFIFFSPLDGNVFMPFNH
jgi:hypothetical protein